MLELYDSFVLSTTELVDQLSSDGLFSNASRSVKNCFQITINAFRIVWLKYFKVFSGLLKHFFSAFRRSTYQELPLETFPSAFLGALGISMYF